MILRRLLALLGLVSLRAAAEPLPRDPRILSYPALTMEPQSALPITLLFSDSPETPAQSGVLYRDTLTGRVRVLAYHANGMTAPARLQVLARNTSAAPVTLTRLRQGSGRTDGPDAIVGQRTLLRYFVSRPRPPVTLAPGAQSVLFDSGPLAPQAVASAMLDLGASGPVELSVVLRGPDVQKTIPAEQLAILPTDGVHHRGTFQNADRAATVELARLPARLTFGGQNDGSIQGQDALTGQPVALAGNYGVVYRLAVRGAPGSLIAASPRGGLYQGLLTVLERDRQHFVLIGDGRALTDPSAPAPLWRMRGDLSLEFVPANGSNLPLALIFYPAVSR